MEQMANNLASNRIGSFERWTAEWIKLIILKRGLFFILNQIRGLRGLKFDFKLMTFSKLKFHHVEIVYWCYGIYVDNMPLRPTGLCLWDQLPDPRESTKDEWYFH